MESNQPDSSKGSENAASSLESKPKSTDKRKKQLTEDNEQAVAGSVPVPPTKHGGEKGSQKGKSSDEPHHARTKDEKKSEEKPGSNEEKPGSNVEAETSRFRDSRMYHASKLRQKKNRTPSAKLDKNVSGTNTKSAGTMKEVHFENNVHDRDSENKPEGSPNPKPGGSQSKSNTKTPDKYSYINKAVSCKGSTALSRQLEAPTCAGAPSTSSADQHEVTTPSNYRTSFETWQPGRTKVMCPKCNHLMQPVFRRSKNVADTILKPSCLISCWPCVVIPFVNSTGLDQVRMFCANCKSLIGIFNAERGMFDIPEDSGEARKK